MNHIYEDAEGMRVEVHTTPAGRNIMFDNIHLGNPQKHAFAGVLVPDKDRESFVHSLAKALGVDVSTASEWNEAFGLPAEGVQVHDYHEDFDPGEWEGKRYCVSGDINDFLTGEEEDQLYRRWSELNLDNGSWSSNYFVADLIPVMQPWKEMGPSKEVDFEFESEGMCFFAYSDSKEDAEALADWINNKGFLK